MVFDNYDVLVRGIPFYENFISICHKLDNVLKVDSFEKTDNLQETIAHLESINVVKEIHDLQFKLIRAKIPLLVSPVSSLATNLRGFISNEQGNIQDNLIKSRKTLFSYINFKYASITYLKIIKYLNMPREQAYCNGYKLVLAVGTTDLSDDVHVNDEINDIYALSNDSRYYVIPLMGCTYDVFKTYITKYIFDYIHIAGHGKENGYICFQGSIVRPEKIENIFAINNRSVDLLFVNCCYSRLFYDQISNKSLSNLYITYKDSLSAQKAFDFSNAFYTSVFVANNDVTSSFNSAQINNSDNNYELLN